MAAPVQDPPSREAERLTSTLGVLPSVVEEQIATRFTDPLQKRGWLWRGRPLDLFALIVVVLGVQTGFDLFVGAGRFSAAWVLARSAPILFIAVVVAIFAWLRPEALSGRRPRKGSKAR